MSHPWDDDDELLRDLGIAVRGLPPAPAEFVAAARTSLTWRTVDAELAELTYDSAADAALLTRTRSGAPARTLAFAGGGVTIELELTEAGVVGQITCDRVDAGLCGGRVTIESTDGARAATAVDEIGCFLLEAPPHGTFRLYACGDQYSVVTGWMSYP